MGEDGKCNTRETYIGFTHHVDVRAHMKLKEDLSRFCDNLSPVQPYVLKP